MQNTQIVFDYHERTKHHPNRYAASLGYMDWSSQPEPFRRYEGSELIRLPIVSQTPSPSYAEIFQEHKPVSLTMESLSQLLQFSLGLAAWKSIGSDRWALRCNASSGNLHPSEATLILPPIDGISEHSVIVHYAPKEHALEILATFETDFWNQLPHGTLLLGISSILWREVWKYGERAFRYTQLDAGHAQRAVEISAKLNFWKTERIDTVRIDDLDRLLGLDQQERYIAKEKEVSDMLLLISPKSVTQPDLTSLISSLPSRYHGKANQLSPAHQYWEEIELIERATHTDQQQQLHSYTKPFSERECDKSAKEVILKRRSAQAMDFGRAAISKDAFMNLMQSVKDPFEGRESSTHLVLFIHQVETLTAGLYLLVRNQKHRETLQSATRKDFLWQEIEPGLFLLEAGNFQPQAKFIACSQDIASDSAFSLGMLCEFEDQMTTYGANRYKELYWECGAIGQQLYLEATSLNLSATGIGCFLDDVMHRLLGLKDNRFQILYHFTIGRAIVDMRLSTEAPY